jgi:putative acetyltransferase
MRLAVRQGAVEVERERRNMPDDVRIAVEPPDQPETETLLAQLDDYLKALYPPQSNHLLDIAALKAPEIRFFVARRQADAVACGALRVDADGYGEIKRMYVSPAARGLGLGMRLLAAIEAEAWRQRLHTLRLETGIHQPEALGLYAAAGYRETGAFGDYPAGDPVSRFFAKRLVPAG